MQTQMKDLCLFVNAYECEQEGESSVNSPKRNSAQALIFNI